MGSALLQWVPLRGSVCGLWGTIKGPPWEGCQWYLPGCSPLPFSWYSPWARPPGTGANFRFSILWISQDTCVHKWQHSPPDQQAPRLPRTSGPPLDTWPATPHLTPGPESQKQISGSLLAPGYALTPRDPRGYSLPRGCEVLEGGIWVVHRPLSLRSPYWTSCGPWSPSP